MNTWANMGMSPAQFKELLEREQLFQQHNRELRMQAQQEQARREERSASSQAARLAVQANLDAKRRDEAAQAQMLGEFASKADQNKESERQFREQQARQEASVQQLRETDPLARALAAARAARQALQQGGQAPTPSDWNFPQQQTRSGLSDQVQSLQAELAKIRARRLLGQS